MLRRRVSLGMAIGCAALGAAFCVGSASASADDARLTVTPAVYHPAVAGNAGPSIHLVHNGHHGGGYGHHHGYGYGGGGYRGYGYGYGSGYARPYYGGYAPPVYGAYYGGYGGYGAYGGYANYGGYRGCW
jgi:hypothetical protein